MRILSGPTLGFAPFHGRVDFPAHSLTLIAKAVVSLVPGGVSTLRSGEQTLPTGDAPYPDGQGAPRYPSDFVPFKGAADLLVVGHYHAPRGRPVHADEVRVQVGAREAKLAVIGKRVWAGTHRFPRAEEAEPFTSLELRWEYALGGPEHPQDPVGRGYMAAPREGLRTPLELPRLERPGNAYWQVETPPEPFCFAPLARTWPGHRALAGTYDARWQRTRWPWFADDCKPAYFSSSVSDLRVLDCLRGDEQVRLTHLHPEHGTYVTQLPGVQAIAAVQRASKFESIPMRLDTLWIDMDAECACLVWRGVCKVADAEASDLDYIWADLAPLEAALTGPAIVARAERAVADEEAAWAWTMPEREPVAPVDLPHAPVDPELPPEIAEALRKLPVAPELSLPVLSAEQQARLRLAEIDATEQLERRWSEPAEDVAPPWTRERVREAFDRGEGLAGLDLSGADLRGADLTGADLRGTLFTRARLDAASFAGANLTGANLEEASLDGADFSEAQLAEADLSKSRGRRIVARRANLRAAVLTGCEWPDACFDGAELGLAFAHTAEFARATFSNAQLTEADFEAAHLDEAVFEAASARASRWVRARLERARFTAVELVESDFAAAKISAAKFERCNLDDAVLEEAEAAAAEITDCAVSKLRAASADLTNARFLRLRGAGAILSDAQLGGTEFTSCELPRADVSRANLAAAELRGCALQGAQFAGADLSGALVLGCDCFEASFEHARLLDCDGSGSSFFGAEFLGAESATFYGRGRDLTRTKLAPPAIETRVDGH